MAVAECIRACAICGKDFFRGGNAAKLCAECRRTGSVKPAGICTIRWCDRANVSNGRCEAHQRGTCSIAGCGSSVQAAGLCCKHYFRTRFHGDANYVRITSVDKPCAWCGKVMTFKPSIAALTTYCSRSCASYGKARKAGKIGSDCIVQCRSCGDVKRHRNRGGVDAFCSRYCYQVMRKRVGAEQTALGRIADNWRRPKTNAKVEAEVASLRRIAKYKETVFRRICSCIDCGQQVLSHRSGRAAALQIKRCRACQRVYGRKLARSSPAYKKSKRICKARRKARERGLLADRIDPFDVFEAHGWRCAICGCDTPKEKRGSYDANAPELDHIIPLARGGLHVRSNVQCSCRACNIAKSDSISGEEMVRRAA